MEYKIIKTLGKGYNAIAYLVEKGDKRYVAKVQKLLPEEEKENLIYDFWKEIDFMKIMYDNPHFIKYYSHRIEKNCKHKLKINYITKSKQLVKKHEIRNNSNICGHTIIEYKGNTIYNMMNDLDLQNKYKLTIQVLYALNSAREKGYSIGDITPVNITYIDYDKEQPIKVFNKYIKCKYFYSIIDYGSVTSKRYVKNHTNPKKIMTTNDRIKYFTDFFLFIYMVGTNRYHVLRNNKSGKIKDLPRLKNILSYIKKDKIWKVIKKNLIVSDPYFKKWIDDGCKEYYARGLWMDELILAHWVILDRVGCLTYLESDLNISNFLPQKDLHFLINNYYDTKVCFTYLMDKIRT